jgi:hypothetical protein
LPLQKIGPRLRELFGAEAKATHSERRRQRIGDRGTSANKPRLISGENERG